MRILIVASGNHGQVAPFVTEQAEALRRAGCTVALFEVKGHGMLSYLRNLKPLKAATGSFRPDIIHAHYGLCGLLATLQRRVPVVVTYHGSDINTPRVLPLSRLAMRRAAFNIFVGRRLLHKAQAPARKSTVLPCGVDLSHFPLLDRQEARRLLNLKAEGHYVLFAGAFDNPVKNAPLAKASVALMPDTELLELKGYTREEVAFLLNASDCLLMTSHSEGSPQVVKEALACNLPVVSVDVGDVAEQVEGLPGCSIAAPDAHALANAMTEAFAAVRAHTTNSDILRRIDNSRVAERLRKIYQTIAGNDA